jgi:DNA-binding MarR family transcriptional regulator
MIARATHGEDRPELSLEEQEAWAGFIRAHATIVKELDAELKASHGLPLSSFDVLAQLGLAPEGRLQMCGLAEAVHLSRSALTRQVDRLEREGLMERHRGERDPRQVFARITERGLERLAEAMPTHLSGVRERFLGRLSRAQIEKLAGVWSQLLETEGRQSGASEGCNDTR